MRSREACSRGGDLRGGARFGAAIWQLAALYTSPAFLASFTATMARRFGNTPATACWSMRWRVRCSCSSPASASPIVVGVLARPAAGARAAAAGRARKLHHGALRHADGGADPVHPVDDGLRLRAEGAGRVSVRVLSDSLQHRRRRAQPEARTDRGRAIVPLERMGDLARSARFPTRCPTRSPASVRPSAAALSAWSPRNCSCRRAAWAQLIMRSSQDFDTPGLYAADPRRHDSRRHPDLARARAGKPLSRSGGGLSDDRATGITPAPPRRLSLRTLPQSDAVAADSRRHRDPADLGNRRPARRTAFVARPSGIIAVFPKVITSPEFWVQARATLGAVFQGLAIAFVTGTIVGVAHRPHQVRRPLHLDLHQRIVRRADDGDPAAVLAVVRLHRPTRGWRPWCSPSFFSIVVNVSDGARSVPPEFIEVSRSFRGSAWSRLFDVILPSSTPYLLAGLRLAAGRALIGAVVAEFFTTIPGLGFFILFQARTLSSQRGVCRRRSCWRGTGVLFEICAANRDRAVHAVVPARRGGRLIQAPSRSHHRKPARHRVHAAPRRSP